MNTNNDITPYEQSMHQMIHAAAIVNTDYEFIHIQIWYLDLAYNVI